MDDDLFGTDGFEEQPYCYVKKDYHFNTLIIDIPRLSELLEVLGYELCDYSHSNHENEFYTDEIDKKIHERLFGTLTLHVSEGETTESPRVVKRDLKNEFVHFIQIEKEKIEIVFIDGYEIFV